MFDNRFLMFSILVMYACFHGHAGAVTAFLNEGADADFRNMAGRTALQLAQKAGFTDASRAILDGPTILVITANILGDTVNLLSSNHQVQKSNDP
jgi:ankyrin repeat protein